MLKCLKSVTQMLGSIARSFFLRCVSIYGAATDTSNYHPLSSPLLKLDAICMALLFFHPPEHHSSGNH